MADNAAYLREWAADIRKSSGKSVDADRLDSIAAEIDDLKRAARNRDMWKGQCERQADELNRLRTLLSSSRGEQGWRTMDSAPTDGTPIIGNTQFGAREIWCPGFVAVELTEYPDGRTCAGYLPGFAPDSRAMYAALLKASHGGTKDAG